MKPTDKSDGAGKAQPWHEADEKPAAGRRGGAPIGTHSFTGGGGNVGMPAAQQDVEAERGSPRDAAPGAEEPDPLAEPRANTPGMLGSKR